MLLEHDHGWGQQRVAARASTVAGTQVGSNLGGLPLSVGRMRPSKTAKINGRRGLRAARAGVPWLRALNAETNLSDSVQGTGENSEPFAGFHTTGENPVAVHLSPSGDSRP